MKKIIVSAAVAAMALSTSAFALEDVKTTGQMKVYYETNNSGDDALFSKEKASAEVVFKVGFTGKQGEVGFGATVYQTSTMGLEGKIVSGTRSGTANGAPFVGEAYITAPIAPSTTLKFGKQELDTPLAFTERWNAIPNTFNAAVAINSSIDNVTLIAAYVGQGSADNQATLKNFGTNNIDGNVATQYFGGATAIAALYANNGLNVNFWAYHIENVLSTGAAGGGVSVNAVWIDGSAKVGPATIKAYAALATHDGTGSKDTSAFALSAAAKLGGVKLFAAASTVSTGDLPIANTATNFKKTKLPTAAVYLDGRYVGQPGSTAFKLKAAGKVGSTGLALQGVYNMNSGADGEKMGLSVPNLGTGYLAEKLEASEIDLIISQKVGVFNLKGILMHRDWSESGHDSQQHVRVIASVNF